MFDFFNFDNFIMPYMPLSCWILVIVCVLARFYFGRDFFVSFYRWLCDLVEKVITPSKNSVFDLYGVYLYCGRVGTGKSATRS